jgi:hypothetical protein
LDRGKALLEGVDDGSRVVHRKGGLGDIGHMPRIPDLQVRYVRHLFDQMDEAAVSALAHGSLHLRVTPVPDEDHVEARLAVSRHLQVYLGHQGAGGIEYRELAPLGLLPHPFGDPVRAEDQCGAGGYLIHLVDEDGAAALEAVDHEAVVDHLVTHVDGGTV